MTGEDQETETREEKRKLIRCAVKWVNSRIAELGEQTVIVKLIGPV